jgi:acyl-CoA synthetase (NDP forming)
MADSYEAQQLKNLDFMLRAKSIAVVGISGPDRFGGQVYDNLQVMGYRGRIYGVNPRYETLYGQKIYASLSELPERPDCAILAVPNSRLLPVLEESASLSVPSAIIYASAFGDVDGVPLQTALIDVARKAGMAVCGPNCMGTISYAEKLAMSGYPVLPDTPSGGITFISHSGSVWDAMQQNNRSIHFNYMISAGNEMVTTMAEYMLYALSDPSTRVIGLFMETVRKPEAFSRALAQAAEKDIPIVVLKVGRSNRGAQLAQAHSGALAGESATYDALFEHYGVQQVRSLDEMMDTLELFASGMRPEKSSLAAILDSGGERSMMVDLAEEIGVDWAELQPNTLATLAELLEPGVEAENPLDAYGTGNYFEEIYVGGMKALSQDSNTGLTVLCVDLYRANTEPPTYPSITIPIKDDLDGPFAVVANASGTAADFKTAEFREAGIPVLMGTETGLRAIRHLFGYTAFQRARRHLLESGSAEHQQTWPGADRIAALRRRLTLADAPLDEVESKQILAAYGIRVSREQPAESLDEAVQAAQAIGYPVAVKTAAGTTHKSEVNGYHLNIASRDEMESAYRDLETRLGHRVVVQEMVPPGLELLLGITTDPQFGPLLMVGIGGVMVELIRDIKMVWLPAYPETIKASWLSLKSAQVFEGLRGKSKPDLDAVVETATRLAQFAADAGDLITELDINPLIAGPDGAIVVDALIIPKSARSTS